DLAVDLFFKYIDRRLSAPDFLVIGAIVFRCESYFFLGITQLLQERSKDWVGELLLDNDAALFGREFFQLLDLILQSDALGLSRRGSGLQRLGVRYRGGMA